MLRQRQYYSNILFTLQAISNFLSPQVAAIFLLGFFWQRTNESGAFWGLMIGFAIGILRFGLEFGYFKPSCGSDLPDERPAFVKHFVDDIHYLHYGALLFLITGLAAIIISLMTEPIPQEKLYRLTYWTRKSAEVRDGFDDSQEEEEEEQTADSEDNTEVTGMKKMIYLICGIPTQPKEKTVKPPQKSRAEMAAEAAAFLNEKKSLKLLVNISAVLSMSLACFVVGFYA